MFTGGSSGAGFIGGRDEGKTERPVEAATVAEEADAPAETVSDGVAAGVADTAGAAGARVVAEPRMMQERFKAEGAGTIPSLKFRDIVKRKQEGGKEMGDRVVTGGGGRRDQSVEREAVAGGDAFKAITEEAREFAGRTVGGVIADVDAHLDFGEVEAGAFAGDVGVLNAKIGVRANGRDAAAKGVVQHQVPNHGNELEGADSGAGLGRAGGKITQDGLDGVEFAGRGAARGVVEVVRLDDLAERDRQFEHAITGVPAAGPENANRGGARRFGGFNGRTEIGTFKRAAHAVSEVMIARKPGGAANKMPCLDYAERVRR